ncbi:MAG: hypoxanthine phosphoribosyltransferase [Deltaproteobacteria bacterium]
MRDEVRELHSAERIAARVRELGAQIAERHPEGELVLLSVLKGSFVFTADLARAIDRPLRIDFLGLSSYGGETESSGVVKITSDLTKPIEGAHVVVVEDIIDTGLTMAYLLENLATRKPASVEVCALLEKPSRARKQIEIHYKGFVIPDEFVVGYGLDFNDRYRNLPYVGILKSPPGAR